MAPTKKTNNNKNGKGKSGSGRTNSSASSPTEQALMAKMYKLNEMIKTLKGNNTVLVREINQLQLDKAELVSQLEAEKKRNGEVVSAGTDQRKLTESMMTSVRSLIQSKYFLYMPMLDKTMFEQSNLLAPVAKNLGIEKKTGPSMPWISAKFVSTKPDIGVITVGRKAKRNTSVSGGYDV